MQRFLHTSAGRAVARLLIAWLVLQPLWEVSQRSGWQPVPLAHLFDQALAFVLPGTAHAAAPMADAGSARTVTKTQPLGSLVILDGTRSQDADGDPLTYHLDASQWHSALRHLSGLGG